MVKKVLLIGILALTVFAFVGCGSGENNETEGNGLIFSDSGTLAPINFYPSDWNESAKKNYSGDRINVFIDAGKQNSKYAASESMYISIVNSIPVIISEEFDCDSDINIYKVVDDVYEFDNMEEYISPTEEELLNKLKYIFFYGSGAGIESVWEDTPEDHKKQIYNTDYTNFTEFIAKDYKDNSQKNNLYIIASSFTAAGEKDDANIFEKFCSSIYRNILVSHEDVTVGIAGFITETKDGESPYFIIALGRNEEVYRFINRIDKANRQSFDEDDFFVVYIDRQIIKQNPESSEYNLTAELGIPKLSACTDCLCELISEPHYLLNAQAYAANQEAEGQIRISLPFYLPQGSSLDISLQAEPSVSMVVGQRLYMGNMSGLADYDVKEGTISCDEYEYVYSKIGPMSEKQRLAAIAAKKQEYYEQLEQQVPDESAKLIVSVGGAQSKSLPIYVPVGINPETMECNMPYVVNIELEIDMTVENDILHYSEIELSDDSLPYSMQDLKNIDTIIQWDKGTAKGIKQGISYLIGEEKTIYYEFTKSINFIIYKNSNIN